MKVGTGYSVVWDLSSTQSDSFDSLLIRSWEGYTNKGNYSHYPNYCEIRGEASDQNDNAYAKVNQYALISKPTLIHSQEYVSQTPFYTLEYDILRRSWTPLARLAYTQLVVL